MHAPICPNSVGKYYLGWGVLPRVSLQPTYLTLAAAAGAGGVGARPRPPAPLSRALQPGRTQRPTAPPVTPPVIPNLTLNLNPDSEPDPESEPKPEPDPKTLNLNLAMRRRKVRELVRKLTPTQPLLDDLNGWSSDELATSCGHACGCHTRMHHRRASSRPRRRRSHCWRGGRRGLGELLQAAARAAGGPAQLPSPRMFQVRVSCARLACIQPEQHGGKVWG